MNELPSEFCNFLTVLSLLISVVTITLALTIYSKEEEQLKKQGKILKHTLSIAEKLSAETAIKDVVGKLFFVNPDKNKTKKYQLFFPAQYWDKPLPSIHQGDFFAINVISMYLGIKNLELKALENNCKKIDSINKDSDMIFICGPQANPALMQKFPSPKFLSKENNDFEDSGQKEIEEKDRICKDFKELKKFFLEKIDLPCWFMEIPNGIGKDGNVEWMKCLQIYEEEKDGAVDSEKNLLQPIISPAEREYKLAEIEDEKFQKKSLSGRVSDHGIFARISNEDQKFFIIAGIHQFGTWIVGDYLNKVINQVICEEHLDIFKSKVDFCALITGVFLCDSLRVESSSVYPECFWIRTKKEKKWRKVKMDKNRRGKTPWLIPSSENYNEKN